MTQSPRRSRVPRAARPLLHAQYRILAFTLVMSLLGAGIWLVSMVFQVKELGGGPLELSFVATANAVGMIVAALAGGVAADRVPQKYILIAVESVKGVSIGTAAVLALTGNLELWHLSVVAVLLGIGDGFLYPAYSAMLPSILPADDLLAANGFEGMLRPIALQAAGPAIAGVIIVAAAPAWGFAVVAIAQLLAVAGLIWLRTTPVRRDLDAQRGRNPIVAMLADVGEGVRYMVRTSWLLGSLLYFSVLVLVITGPIDVLLPFVVTDELGGNAGDFALALAAYGVGGAIGSIVVASFRLPRRYLTVMMLAWSAGALPLAIVGITDQFWLLVAAVFVVGIAFSAGGVIWGTLLQRRIPPAMLGRVSSLDFFVSLVFMPISMALAGPVGVLIGYGWTFAIAGLLPVVLGVLALLIARMPRDEIAHPLDDGTDMLEGRERPSHTGSIPTALP